MSQRHHRGTPSIGSTIPASPTSQYATMYPPPVASSSRPHSYNTEASNAQTHDEDEDDDAFDPFAIDPNYRLKTVRTAHSVLAESIRSERDAEDRKRHKKRMFSGLRRKGSSMTVVKESLRSKRSESDATTDASENGMSRRGSKAIPAKSDSPSPEEKKEKGKEKAKSTLPRREIFINNPLPTHLLTTKGEPIVRYVRNKVRTSKYTLITFIPKNLFEQFRRVANIFFLAMVILQVFPIFGATNAQIGMLPLLAILGMTAIKDGIEDWRRAKLDNEVNNSATTKLGGGWRNVNQPSDPRSFLEKLFGLGPVPGKASKGVRKLRQSDANAGLEIVMERQKAIEEEEEELASASAADKGLFPLDDIQAVPRLSAEQGTTGRSGPLLRKALSTHSIVSRKSEGVMDWESPSSGNAHWERTLWKKLEVGDFVLLRDNDQVPADIVVLSSSNADGLAFVETKNLDGETNLKVRRALKATININSEEDLEHSKFVIDSEPPHANLYTYNGVLKYRLSEKGEDKQEAVTINELLLRGCSIRNTKWVIGLVVFTGADTKIMLNGGDTPSKRSKIEKETNFNVIMNFLILLILCTVTALLHGWYRSQDHRSANYYEIGSAAAENIYLDSVIIFASCLIVFQNIVPISLYITIEIVKSIQAFFIFQDVEMYYAPYDTPCVPKTWNISDDLGQIEYVFSDKTGTLTQNIMEFKKCSIQGVSFGEGLTEAMMGAAKRDGRDLGPAMASQNVELDVMKEDMIEEMKRTIDNRYFREDKLTLIAPDLPRRMTDKSDPLRPHLINFFRALAICHSVLSDVPELKKPFEVDYKAESPDEAALVAAARDVGFPFVNKSNTRIDIEVLGETERWVPLRMLEFNSTRKRMSVIARDPSGRIVLFCKGADSVIYERLKHDHDPKIKDSTLRDLETYANGGLRTLCIAHRYLEEEEYEDWVVKYDAATAAVNDREETIEKAAEMIEHSLEIIGATALEDKLQEGVPDSIAMLHRAGIKLWILTGDKLQTAIEIGYSCNLLTNDMEVMIISADSEAGARSQIEAGLNKIASINGAPIVNMGNKRSSKAMTQAPGKTTFAVVIDGESLRYALQPNLKGLFLSLGTQCAAVICCRVSPSQKALTVRLVKEGCNAMTLSIGDGANDVAMIQEANVGVGLYGLEGSQAAMSADYAFGQFRFLTRLLLVHGRWSYTRIADMHANFFYKNIIWTISMFWFLIFNSFDATYLFEYTFMLLYNLVFTSLPVGMMGAFDQDTNAKASLAFPQLYKRGIQGLDYTRTRFWLYMTDGLYQSAVIFFIPFLAYGTGTTWNSGGLDTNSLWDLGTTVAVAGVFSANLYVGINTKYWTIITWVTVLGSILLIYLWIPIYSYLAGLPYYGEVSIIFSSFSFWAITLITVFIAVGPRWLGSAFRQSYFPRDKDIVREAWVGGSLKDDLGIQHRKDIKLQRKASRQRGESLSGMEMPVATYESYRPSALVDHLHKALGDGVADERGLYEPANISSPQKELKPRSPLMSVSGSISPGSGRSTPRSPFSYPPEPNHYFSSPLVDNNLVSISPNPGPSHGGTVPPPLNLPRQNSASRQPHSPFSPGYAIDSAPVSDISYTSPTAVETFQMTNQEIQRLSRASIDLGQATSSDQYEYSDSVPPTATFGKRNSMTLGRMSDRRWPAHDDDDRRRSVSENLSRQPYGTQQSRGGQPSVDFSENAQWQREVDARRSNLDLEARWEDGNGIGNSTGNGTARRSSGYGGYAV